MGFFMYLNFSQVGPESLFVYYPVMLLGVSATILFNPLKIFYFRTRMWLIYSVASILSVIQLTLLISIQWRLLLAGIYPVEWRDFYLGDMFCSLTYSMGVRAAVLSPCTD